MARPQAFLSIGRVPLIGGSLCLDFTNTAGARETGAPRERLRAYDDLLVWCRRVGVISGNTERGLARAAGARTAGAHRALRRLRAMREDLYELLREVAAGRPAPKAHLARLSDHWRAARARQVLLRVRGTYQLTLVADTHDLGWMAFPIVESAVTLLTSERRELLRRCAECDWLYVDDTKNHSRRWCQQSCGNRARSRRRYAGRRRG